MLDTTGALTFPLGFERLIKLLPREFMFASEPFPLEFSVGSLIPAVWLVESFRLVLFVGCCCWVNVILLLFLRLVLLVDAFGLILFCCFCG